MDFFGVTNQIKERKPHSLHKQGTWYREILENDLVLYHVIWLFVYVTGQNNYIQVKYFFTKVDFQFPLSAKPNS